MATTPTVALCDNLAAAVSAAWTPVAPDGVSRAYFFRAGDSDGVSVPALTGRQVVFFPTRYEWENETRARDRYTHHVGCMIAERYGDGTPATASDPPQSWIDARVDFVHARIVQGLRYTRTGPPSFNPFLMTLGAAVEVLDVKKLLTGGRLFFCLVELEFEELVTP